MSEIPDMSLLPSVTVKDIKSLPDCIAVYFILSPDGQILYIGSAQNLRARWVDHHKRYVLTDDGRIAWWVREQVGSARLDEARLIKAIRPPLNTVASPSVSVSTRLPEPLYGKVERIAQAEHRSIAQMVVMLLLESPRLKGKIRENGNKKAGK